MNIKNKLLESNIFEDNIYLDKYCNLINNNLNNYYQKGITECHHIIPRHCFNYRNIEVDNSNTNLVNLSYSDHILAHYYLCFCLIEDEDIDNSMFAFITMIKTNKNKYLDNLQLSEEKILEIKENYFRNHIVKDITKTKISEANKKNHKGARWMNDGLHDSFVLEDYIEVYLQKGWNFGRLYKVSNNTKSKISSTLTGRTHNTSQETKDKISASHKGKIYINKDDIVKSIHKQELDNYLQQGWSKGNPNARGNLGNKGKYRYVTNGVNNIQLRYSDSIPEGFYEGYTTPYNLKYKMKLYHSDRTKESYNTTGGTIVVNNTIVNKHIRPEELDSYLTNGWVKGVKKRNK